MAFCHEVLVVVLVTVVALCGGGLAQPESSTKDLCSGWHLNVESYNIRDWPRVPSQCHGYVKKYMEKGQYQVDFGIAVDAASSFFDSVQSVGAHDAVMFDVDEVLLSTQSYRSEVQDYGNNAWDPVAFAAYVATGSSPAIPLGAVLYNKVKAAGYKIIVISGRAENLRDVTSRNLIAEGFFGWDELIMKSPEYDLDNLGVFKEKARLKVVAEKGYTFLSCIGDQYSDCLGAATGRAFKLPNPMYFAK